jgi:hypothetical protein
MCTDMGDSDTHDNGDHNERELRDITHETADVSAVHNINADNDDDAQRDTDTPALPPLFASAEMLAHVTLTRRGGGRRRRHSRLAVGDDDSSGSSSNNADDGEHTAILARRFHSCAHHACVDVALPSSVTERDQCNIVDDKYNAKHHLEQISRSVGVDSVDCHTRQRVSLRDAVSQLCCLRL